MNTFFSRKIKIRYLVILFILLALFIILAASLGSANLSIKETAIIIAKYVPGVNYFIDWRSINPQSLKIITQIRLPRIFLSIFAGIGLASAGVIFQGIFRNPMADPFIIGVSSGASLGAPLALLVV